jgi:hypothetical protein
MGKSTLKTPAIELSRQICCAAASSTDFDKNGFRCWYRGSNYDTSQLKGMSRDVFSHNYLTEVWPEQRDTLLRPGHL